MKPWSLVCCLLFSQLVARGAEPEPQRAPVPRQSGGSFKAPKAWLGLRLEKPDPMVTAQLPDLPPGIGFLVKSVDQGGPAQAAGLQELDVVWKLGDQMLVNEAQLAALLRLSKPGDEVVLSGFRAGEPLESKVILGESKRNRPPATGPMVESAILPESCDAPVRLVNVAEKKAGFSSEDGSASVWREGDGFRVKILGPEQEMIFEGAVSDEGSALGLPERWDRKIRILVRTLKRTLDGNVLPVRQPRPRVVSPASPP